MQKHLIITGAQGIGKTELGKFLTHMDIFDGCNKNDIKDLNNPTIFITNERVKPNEFDSNIFLVIRLTHNIPFVAL